MARDDHTGDEAQRCGGCGAHITHEQYVCEAGVAHGVCTKCMRLQEVETRDIPEAKMCDNCAFRQGSPERADPWRWLEIQETLDKGQPFHCHKGLPLDHVAGRFEPPDAAKGRVTVCAGWLASRQKQLEG